tara:strand:- start:784 stop:4281 length:3498 start_codon:yes stop_codon:yes gene_type:complete
MDDDITGATPAQEKTIATLRAALSMDLPIAKRQQVGQALAAMINKIEPVPEPTGHGSSLTMDNVEPQYAVENSKGEEEFRDNTGKSAMFGMDTAYTQQQSRFLGAEYRVQAGIQHVLAGGQLSGIDSIDTAVAVNKFASSIDGSPKEFAAQMSVDAIVNLPTSMQEKRMILSMLGDVAGFEQRGAGGSMIKGNIHTGIHSGQTDKTLQEAERLDNDMRKAMGYAKDIAAAYVSPKTPMDSDFYKTQHAALEHFVINRAMESVQYAGAKSVLALPNETGVTGIRPTMSYRGYLGTSFTRVGFEVEAEKRGWDATQDIYWEHKGSLKNSLFPMVWKVDGVPQTKQKRERDQNYLMGQLEKKAEFMRRVFQKQMPTNRDESAGQNRTSGFDRPYGDQADRINTINEAEIQDLEIEDVLSGAVSVETDEAPKPNIEGIEQRTPEWYAARKGMITASKLTDMKGVDYTAEEIAATMARERLGHAKEFIGNAHSQEGIDGERKALTAFLNKMNKSGDPLQHTEVGLIQNPMYKGFGASPDGRLTDAEGNNRGLLELKYLSPSSMDAAKLKKKYGPQMQLQMAITGEDVTEFFALDKNTNESIHMTIARDQDAIDGIIKTGNAAMKLERGLDEEGIQKLEKQTAEMRKSGNNTPVDSSGQTASFSKSSNVDAKAISYVDAKAISYVDVKARVGAAEGSVLGKMMQKADQDERKKAIKGGFDSVEAMNDFNSANEEAAEASEELASASKSAAASLKVFEQTASKAGKVMAGVAESLLGAGASGMDTIRLAAESGMSESATRGLEFAFQSGEGGMTESSAKQTIMAAANMRTTFNDDTQVGAAITGIATRWGGSKLEETLGFTPQISDFKGQSTQQILSTVRGWAAGQGKETQTQIYAAVNPGLAQMAVTQLSANDLLTATGSIDPEGIRSFRTGQRDVQTLAQTSLEFTAGATGYAGGAAAQTTEFIAGSKLLSSASNKLMQAATAMLAGSGGAVLAGGGAAAAGVAASKAGAIAQAAKAGTAAIKATPIAAISGAVPQIVRHVAGVEDDNGVADSALDILDFAAAGAGVGGIIGMFGGPLAPVTVPFGSAVGGAIGAGAGLINEAFEYFGDDSMAAIPEAGISSNLPAAPVAVTVKAGENNINVTMNVDDQGNTTSNVNVNGDEQSDHAQGY